MSKGYEDCESCAFEFENTVICDDCEEADMWEPVDADESSFYSSRKIIKIKRVRYKEAA